MKKVIVTVIVFLTLILLAGLCISSMLYEDIKIEEQDNKEYDLLELANIRESKIKQLVSFIYSQPMVDDFNKFISDNKYEINKDIVDSIRTELSKLERSTSVDILVTVHNIGHNIEFDSNIIDYSMELNIIQGIQKINFTIYVSVTKEFRIIKLQGFIKE